MSEIDSQLNEHFDPADFIRSINSNMSAEQAVKQIAEYNRHKYNKTKAPVIGARNELLLKAGYNPEGWVFYTNTQPIHEESPEEMMIRLGRDFPKDVEFLVIQGSFLGGVTGTPGISSSWGVVKYRYDEEGYSAFVRVRPKQLDKNTDNQLK